MDLVADGLQVALLWEMRQQGLHAAVELFFAFKLKNKTFKPCKKVKGRKKKMHIKQEHETQ